MKDSHRRQTHPVDHLATLLKERYKKFSVGKSDWAPWPVGNDAFCKLSMLKHSSKSNCSNPKEERQKAELFLQGSVNEISDHQFESYSPIELWEFFQALEDDSLAVPHILIRGPPGIGKTTLCLNTCQMWGNGEILTRYSLVLYLPLRDTEVGKAESFFDLLTFSGIGKSLAENVSSWIEEDGKDVLLVIDGWDELDVNLRSSSMSFVSSVVKGKRAGHVAFFITSRPQVITPKLKECFTCEVEILGFTKEEVKIYISEKLANKKKSDTLISYLEAHPNLTSFCSIPSVCIIVMVAFDNTDELPVTLSELYETFVLSAINKHESKDTCDRILSLTNLPELLSPYFLKLCEFSYNSLCKKVFHFKDKLLDDNGLIKLVRERNGFSLMTAYPVVIGDEFQFLHLTIQEFLAAWWIAHHDECVKMFHEHYGNDHFNMTLKFVAGISKLKDDQFHDFFCKPFDCTCPHAPFPWYILRQQEKVYYSKFKSIYVCSKPKIHRELFFILQLIYESQNPVMCEVVAACMRSEICLCGFHISLMFEDFIVLNYFLSHCKKHWAALHLVINPSLPLLTVLKDKQIADQVLVHNNASPIIGMHCIKYSEQIMKSLVTALHFSNLQSLFLTIHLEDLHQLSLPFKSSGIRKLKLFIGLVPSVWETIEQWCEQQQRYWASVTSAMQANSSLEELYLHFDIPNEFIATARHHVMPYSASSSHSVTLSYNRRMERLFMSMLAKALSDLVDRKSLRVFKYGDLAPRGLYHFNETKRDQSVLETLTMFCTKSSSLQVLDLSPGMVLPEDCLETIASHFTGFSLRINPLIVCYKLNDSITHLNLSHANLNDDAMLMISNCLEESTSITHLDLSDNAITEKGADTIFNSIASTSVLRELIMNRNKFTGGKDACSVMGKSLAEMLNTSKSLRTLYLLMAESRLEQPALLVTGQHLGLGDHVLDCISSGRETLSLAELGVSVMYFPFTPQHVYKKFFKMLAAAKIGEVALQFRYDVDSLIPYLCEMIACSTSLETVIISVAYHTVLKPLKYTHKITIDSLRSSISLRKLCFVGYVDHTRLLPDLTLLKEQCPNLEILASATYTNIGNLHRLFIIDDYTCT